MSDDKTKSNSNEKVNNGFPLEELVESLSQNPQLISIIEEQIANVIGTEDGIDAQSVDCGEITRRVIRQVAQNSTRQQHSNVPSGASVASNKSNKSVTFSSISASIYPSDFSGGDVMSRPLAPPQQEEPSHESAEEPLLPADQIDAEYSANEDAVSALSERSVSLSGEPTASGDSSIASVSNHGGRHDRTGAGSGKQVLFSAINPSPNLALVCDENDDHILEGHKVSFTFDNEVTLQAGNFQGLSSRGSRSGLSSPSYEPPASPPRSRSSSVGVSINDSTIEVISEVAARLRSENSDEGSVGAGGRTNRVHFSAMKETVSAKSATINDNVVNNAEDDSIHHVHFAGNVAEVAMSQEAGRDMNTEEEMRSVAERLRRIIRRAEELGNLTLEDAFAQLDIDHSGIISAEELQTSLRRLGSTFEFTVEECSSLLVCLTGHENSEGMNLLSFYRAMGRRSPPMPETESSTVAHMDLSESPAVHADNAASRLRSYILQTEQEGSSSVIQSTFRFLDTDNSGFITASEFHDGLRNLGSTDENPPLDDEDCEELVTIFDANDDGKVSLIDFYRFMGRRSPPLPDSTNIDDQAVKRDKSKTSADESVTEHDHFRDFFGKKKRDDEDDESGVGGGGNMSSGSSSMRIVASSTNNSQNDSNSSSNENNGSGRVASQESHSARLAVCENLPVVGAVEVVIDRPASLPGVILPFLLNDTLSGEEKNYADSSSLSECDRISRDDCEFSNLMSVNCQGDKESRIQATTSNTCANNRTSAIIERAIIEIDYERTSSPIDNLAISSLSVNTFSAFDLISPSLRRSIYNSSPIDTHRISNRSSLSHPAVELSYDEVNDEIQVLNDENRARCTQVNV